MSRSRELVQQVFQVLDKHSRGYVSKAELANLVEAMLVDPNARIEIPEGLINVGRDSKLTFGQLEALLSTFKERDLEDLLWFADSVIKVEKEMREQWEQAVTLWFEAVKALNDVDLDRYLISSQPDKIARWIGLRCKGGREGLSHLKPPANGSNTSLQHTHSASSLRSGIDENGGTDSAGGYLGLGVTMKEVEVLFTNDTHSEVIESYKHILPFSSLLTRCSSLKEMLVQCSPADDVVLNSRVETDEEQQTARDEWLIHRRNSLCNIQECIAEIDKILHEYPKFQRGLCCLLADTNMLSLFASLVGSPLISPLVWGQLSTLIRLILDLRIEYADAELESRVRGVIRTFIEIDFAVDAFDLNSFQQSLLPSLRLHPSEVAKQEAVTDVTEWIRGLLTIEDDYERGKSVDFLIQWDRKRFSNVSAGEGDVEEEEEEEDGTSVLSPVVSPLAHGKVIVLILNRLATDSYHLLHESRTPIRAHLVKLLFSLLQGAGAKGRMLFRASRGMDSLNQLFKGKVGVRRVKLPAGYEWDELDYEEQEELLGIQTDFQRERKPADAMQNVRKKMSFDPLWRDQPFRFYEESFLDNSFYGSKDKDMAMKMLICLLDESVLWGPQAVMEEMLQSNSTLETLVTLKPPPLDLIQLLLSSPLEVSKYLKRIGRESGEAAAKKLLKFVDPFDSSSREHECFSPFTFDDVAGADGHMSSKALREKLIQTIGLNSVLRLLAFCKGSLEQSGLPVEQIEPLIQLLAKSVPIDSTQLNQIVTTAFFQLRDFYRKVGLRANPLPPKPAPRPFGAELVTESTADGLESKSNHSLASPVSSPRKRNSFDTTTFNKDTLDSAQPLNAVRFMFATPQYLSQAGASGTHPRAKKEYSRSGIDSTLSSKPLFSGESRHLLSAEFPQHIYNTLLVLQLAVHRESSTNTAFLKHLMREMEKVVGLVPTGSFAAPDMLEDDEHGDSHSMAEVDNVGSVDGQAATGAIPEWRSALFPVITVKVSDYPARRSLVKRYPQNTLPILLRSLSELSSSIGHLFTIAGGEHMALCSVSFLLSHLCFTEKRTVKMERSAQGVWERLGLTDSALKWLLNSFREEEPPASLVRRVPNHAGIDVFLVKIPDSKKEIGFVHLNDSWMLWANCPDDMKPLTNVRTLATYF